METNCMRLESLLVLALAVLSGVYACSPSPPLPSAFLAGESIKFSDPSVVTLFWTPANISSCPGAIENYVVVQANLTGQTLEPVYNAVLCNVTAVYSCNVSIPFLESLENSQGVIVNFFVLLYYYSNASPIYDNSAYSFTFCSSAPPLPAEIISPVSGTIYLFAQSKFNTSYASITFDWQSGSPAAGDFGRDCSASPSYEALLVISQDYNNLQQTSLSNISAFYYSNPFAAPVSSSYPLTLGFGLGSSNPLFSSAGVWYWRIMRTNSMYIVGSVTFNFTVQSYPDPCSPVCNPIGGVCNVSYPFVNGTCNCTSSYTGPTCSDPIPPTPTPTAIPTATPTATSPTATATPTATPTATSPGATTPQTSTPTSSAGSPSGSTSQTPTPTLSAGSPSDDPGAIAGGVVGGLLGLVLLVLLLWFLKLRYWSKPSKKNLQNDDISSSTPTELVSTNQYQQFNSRVSIGRSLQSPTTDSRSSFSQVQPATDSNYSVLPTRTTDDLYISVNSLTFGAVLGQGHFGQVFQADYTGAQVAVKKLKGVDENLMLEEAKMMKSIPPHPNVLQYYGICQVSDEIMMVMEFCDKGNLAAYLRSPSNKLTPQECRQLCCQIASGMWHISLYGIIHRDLRAENILLRGTQLEAKVADFGLARSLQSHNDNSNDQAYYRMAEIKPIPVAWTPPEVLDPVNRLKYLAASDVWSFGVVMWEIYSRGAKPFDGNDVQLTVAIIRDANRVVPLLPKPKNCPKDILAIMQSCWAFNPQARPSFEKLFRQLA